MQGNAVIGGCSGQVVGYSDIWTRPVTSPRNVRVAGTLSEDSGSCDSAVLGGGEAGENAARVMLFGGANAEGRMAGLVRRHHGRQRSKEEDKALLRPQCLDWIDTACTIRGDVTGEQ